MSLSVSLPIPSGPPSSLPSIASSTVRSSSVTGPVPSISGSASRSASGSLSDSATSGSSTTTTTELPSDPTPAPGASVRVTTSGNLVITITSIVQATPTNSVHPASTGSAASRPFLQNKAAVAGVFSVVGIIGVALIFIFLTNAIRRRRAEQFDRDVAEAAAAAAAAQPPVFDDEDDIYGSHGKLNGYSDNSHGTYGQPPMSHIGTSENYGVVRPSYDPFGTNMNAGAAGVGVGAAMQRARSRKEIRDEITGAAGMPGYDTGGGIPTGYGEQPAPYPAFSGGPQVLYNSAAPPPVPGQGAQAAVHYGPGNATYDLMDAAGLGSARGPSQGYPNAGYPDLSRSRSQGTKTLGAEGAYGSPTGHEHVQGESYAARYQPGYQHQSPSPPLPSSNDDAYGGVGPLTPADPARPTSRDGSSSDYSDADADNQSLKDEEDYELERGKRILKVTNA